MHKAEPWAALFPETVTITLANRPIHVLHDLAELDLDPSEQAIEIVVSGYSHRPKAETVDGVLYLNPGSAGPRRFRLPITVATIDLTHDAIRPVIHELNP